MDFPVKFKPNGSVLKYKTRLVAKGFLQNPGFDYVEPFSLVVKAPTIRVLFSLTVSFGWEIQQVDVNNAFLNGNLAKTVYMAQSEGFVNVSKPTHVCRLIKSLYGLKQAPRAWYNKLKEALISLGFIRSVADASLFIKRIADYVLFVLVYVDDILLTGSSSAALQACIHDLDCQFALKTLGAVNYFLGFEAYRNTSGLYLTQTKYVVDLLKKVGMEDCKPCDTPMNAGLSLTDEGEDLLNPALYRTILGSLQYLTYTRPDIAFAVNKLSQFSSKPKSQHLLACKRLLRYIKGIAGLGLFFSSTPGNLGLTIFTDADHVGCKVTRRSISGFCVYLGQNLIVWGSKKQSIVARSVGEAEYRSVALGVVELLWLKSLFVELGYLIITTLVLWCDNLAAKSMAENSVFHSRMKHVGVDMHFVREKVESGEVEIRYVPTSEQIADILSKSLPRDKFQMLCSKLRLA